MEKKDVDLYLERIKNSTTEEEKLEETKKFYKLITENIAKTQSNRYITLQRKVSQDLINYCVESGALNICHEIGFSKILDLTRVIGKVARISTSPNKKELIEKMTLDIENFLQTDDLLAKEDIDIYDGIATRYFYTCIEENKDIGDLGKKVVTTLFSHLPKDKLPKETMLYKLQLVRGSRTRDDIFEVTPKDPIEKYEEILFNPKLQSNGKIANFEEYDNLMFEYLCFYGSRSVEIDKKMQLFENIIDNSRPGRLNNSKTYFLYFMKSDYDDDQMVTYSFNGTIAKDVLARIHETDGKSTVFTDFEFDLFENRYLPRMYDIEKEDPEFFKSMPDIPPKIKLKGDIEQYLEELYIASSVQSVEIAKYVIRLQNIFKKSNRPKNEKLAKVYDYVKSINAIDALKKNLTPDELREIDPNFDYNKIVFRSEEEKNEPPKKLKKLQKRKKDPNVKYGLRRIDYADIALSLMIESDFIKGSGEFVTAIANKTFQNNGRNIYDSRAVRKLVELYVNNPDLRYNYGYLNDIIYKYVSTAVSKPDFNLFKEQGVSDLLQLVSTKNLPIGENIKNLVQEGINQNPRYSMSLEESEKYVNDFINVVGKESIDSSKEAGFDKFLVALTKMRIASPESLLPQNATDFLLEQMLRKDSIINIMSDKYSGVKERTLENLGKLDNKNQNGNSPLSYMYLVRDYIYSDTVLGNHEKNIISIKRENVDRLADGDFHVINTIFHENTHMAQSLREDKIPRTFKEYMMIKEEIIRKKIPKYYNNNYILYYKEIDARENAAKKTADYISRMIPEDSTLDFAENLHNSVVEMICDKFKEEQAKYSLESQREGKLYDEGLNQKVDSNGKKRKISEIFDQSVSSNDIYINFFKRYPGLMLEYNSDGRKRTFYEQLMFANNYKENLNLQMMREIIKDSGIASYSKDMSPLIAIKKLAIDAKTKEDIEFVNGVVGDNLSTAIKSYILTINERIKQNTFYPTSDILVSYSIIKDFIEFANKNPNAPGMEVLRVKNDMGKDSLDLLQFVKESFEKIDPNIGTKAADNIKARQKENVSKQSQSAKKPQKKSILGRIFHHSYAQLRDVEADVEGKRNVTEYEANLERKEQTLEEK